MKRIAAMATALIIALMCLSGLGALAEGQIVTTGDVYLRKGPGLDYKKILSIEEGETLYYDKTSKDDRGVTWYRVSYDFYTGWVSSAYARKSGSQSNGDSGTSKRVTTTGDVHLRQGPGLDYASRTVVDAGETLTYDKTSVDERDVVWYHVSYDGMKGWISSVYARKGSGSSDGRVRMTGNANVRTGPGLDYGSIGTVSEGASLVFLGTTREDERGVEWYKVSYRGDTGWVSSKYAWIDD